MPNLYELTDQYLQIAEALENDPDADASGLLQEVEGELEDKVKNCAALIEQWDLDVEALKEHKRRIDKRIKAVENRKKRLRDWLRFNMSRAGITRIASPFFTVTLKRGQERVVVDDIDKLPSELVMTERHAAKGSILATIKHKGPIDGAHLEDGDDYVEIRK